MHKKYFFFNLHTKQKSTGMLTIFHFQFLMDLFTFWVISNMIWRIILTNFEECNVWLSVDLCITQIFRPLYISKTNVRNVMKFNPLLNLKHKNMMIRLLTIQWIVVLPWLSIKNWFLCQLSSLITLSETLTNTTSNWINSKKIFLLLKHGKTLIFKLSLFIYNFIE